MSTYAAYYNLTEADKAAQLQKQRRVSAESKDSVNSTTSSVAEPTRRKSSVQKILSALRPTEEVLTPSAIYAPGVKASHKTTQKNGKKSASTFYAERSAANTYGNQSPIFSHSRSTYEKC